MTHYLVVTPERCAVYPILDDGTGPMEYWRDVVTVDALNKREARKMAVQSPELAGWVDERRGDDMNPFTGLEVEDMTCPHGGCWCENCADGDGLPSCPICAKRQKFVMDANWRHDRTHDGDIEACDDWICRMANAIMVVDG